jgi:hypothetical protein
MTAKKVEGSIRELFQGSIPNSPAGTKEISRNISARIAEIRNEIRN